MRATVFLTSFFLLFAFSKAFSQSSFIYFKSAQAYITLGNDPKPKGPVSSDDIVTINNQLGEITFLSSSAKVYKILKTENKKAENNNAYTQYTLKDRDGQQIILSILKMVDRKENDTRIIYMNPDGTGLMVLEGNVHKVF